MSDAEDLKDFASLSEGRRIRMSLLSRTNEELRLTIETTRNPAIKQVSEVILRQRKHSHEVSH